MEETDLEVESSVGDDIRAALSELEKPNEPAKEAAPPAAEKPAAEPRARDSSGKFAAKQQSPEPIPANPEQVAEVQAPVTPTPAPAPTERPPVSWKPQTREKWAALDPEVRSEISRREREIDDALRTSAPARKLAQDFMQVVQPYMPIIQASNSTPIQAVQNLMQTAAALRTGTPQNKAQLIAQVINEYGVDIGMLSNALEGKVSAAPDAALQQMLDQRLQPFQQFMQEMQTNRQRAMEQAQQTAQEELSAFVNDAANEYVNDVREDMADLLEAAARRGQKLSLQDAYRRAILLHPQISQLVAQKQLQEQASQQSQAAERARQASASVPNMGAPSQSGDDDSGDGSIRSALRASIRAHSR